MSDERFQISPELDACLRDLAARPDAKLFRFDARKLMTADVAGALYRKGVATPGLAAVEREILAVHRAEMAWLLRVLFLEAVQQHPIAGPSQYYDGPRMSRDEWCQRVDVELEGAPSTFEAMGSVEILRSCLRRGSLKVELGRIALASLHLEESDVARLQLAQALLADSQPRSAEGMLQGLLARPSKASIRQSAWHFLAIACDRQGRGMAGLRALSSAAQSALAGGESQRGVVIPLIQLLAHAIRWSEEQVAGWAADTLEGICAPGEVVALDRWRPYVPPTSPEHPPCPGWQEVARKIESRWKAAAGGVAHALLTD